MGSAKKAAQEHEDKLSFALGIAIEAGVVKECEHHDSVYLEGNVDIEAAYRLGNAKYSAGELEGSFNSRREMTDLIQEAVRDNSGDECHACAKWLED